MSNTSNGLLLALASGLLSWAATFLPESIGLRWGAGVIFGLVVLAPSRRETTQRIAWVALSAVAYRAAVWLAQELHTEADWPAVASCALAGIAGVGVVSLGTSAVARARADLHALARAALPGVLAGVLIGLAVEADDASIAQHALLAAGYVTWQVGYTAAHRLTPWPRRGVLST